jgi:hypothetical protein
MHDDMMTGVLGCVAFCCEWGVVTKFQTRINMIDLDLNVFVVVVVGRWSVLVRRRLSYCIEHERTVIVKFNTSK